MPRSRHVRAIRMAISPRFAIRSFCFRAMWRHDIASTVGGHVLNEDALARALGAAGLSAPVRWDDATGSTNATALAMAAEGTPAWTLVAAGHQTAGRGRHGRTWLDRPGVGAAVQRGAQAAVGAGPHRAWCSLAAGAAMAEAAPRSPASTSDASGPTTCWSVGRRSAASSRSRRLGGGIGHVVVGIGVNLEAPDDVPGAGGDRARRSGGAADGVPPAVPRADGRAPVRGDRDVARGVRHARSARRGDDGRRRHRSRCRRRPGRDRGVARRIDAGPVRVAFGEIHHLDVDEVDAAR